MNIPWNSARTSCLQRRALGVALWITLAGIGFLRVFDPRFRDPTAARRDIERALAMSPDAARDTDAQAVLRALAAGTVPGIQPGR